MVEATDFVAKDRTRLRTAKALLTQGRERSSSPFRDFRVSRDVTWVEPTLHVEVTYSEIMEGRLRDPVSRGLARGASAVNALTLST
jgi:hypothetical protein